MIAQTLLNAASITTQPLNTEPNRQPLNIQSLSAGPILLPSCSLKKGAQSKFSKAASSYNHHANVQKQAADDLFKLIKANANSSNKAKLCIDLGAGPLVNTHTLQTLFGSVIAMDLSLNMLQSSALNTPRLCADMDNLPLQANSIDIIYSNFAVQWSADFAQLLKSLYTALKPGGQVYISCVIEGSLNEIKTAFSALDNNSHINTFNSEQYINQSVQKSGFTINTIQKALYSDEFTSPLNAIRSIKAIGATAQNHSNTRRGLLTKHALQQVCSAYPLKNNKAHVSYHVMLLALCKKTVK
ncbi:methyltransferase domain-containing protein [Pseudoalteromonas translucida]|uniref:Desthiobiotin biosynthesis reaction prior to pimeloyl CoA n=1 Tax=Pseudoalteromonas translucida (strain TAC 125) TaxID=326442 RepID=Q3IGS8_PSET1|nr:methyltransferase domain-containing protein [Pseudoalteromonas translucida]CAI86680.1 desthiobiotin biosynthesis; reaction prior to pimeloyl CoA [Pseudoalteromonas translucida]